MGKEKKCNKCQTTKPVTEFYAMVHGKYGVKSHCRECEKAYRKKIKKEQTPGENDPYIINQTTLKNHFYIHFGFSDKRTTMSEYAMAKKYSKDPINTQQLNAK